MGRTATIDKNDVLGARDELRAAGRPHGIIAIRKHLGRGSPGLIARLLGELDGVAPTKLRVHAPTTMEAAISQITKALYRQRPPSSGHLKNEDMSTAVTEIGPRIVEKRQMTALTERDAKIDKLHRRVAQLEQRAVAAEAQSALLRATAKAAQGEILAQRRMFEKWRADLLRDRALLGSPVDQLTVTIAGPGSRPKPAVKATGGGQLDLYGAGDRSD